MDGYLNTPNGVAAEESKRKLPIPLLDEVVCAEVRPRNETSSQVAHVAHTAKLLRSLCPGIPGKSRDPSLFSPGMGVLKSHPVSISAIRVRYLEVPLSLRVTSPG